MLTLKTILNEIKDVPENRLDELYQFVHSLTSKSKNTLILRKKILSFAGLLNEFSEEEYSDFLMRTKEVRDKFFDRNIDL